MLCIDRSSDEENGSGESEESESEDSSEGWLLLLYYMLLKNIYSMSLLHIHTTLHIMVNNNKDKNRFMMFI